MADIIAHFLAKNGYGSAPQEPLPGDASSRRYIRLHCGHTSRLLMIDPPPLSTLKAYLDVASLLRLNGFRVPAVEAADVDEGLAIMEDWGSKTFTQCIRDGHCMESLYTAAITVLIQLRKTFSPSTLPHVPTYSPELIARELEVFAQWYYPAMTGRPLDGDALSQLNTLVIKEWTSLEAHHPSTLVLRDFHIDNMMVVPGHTALEICGLLDFQDAVVGPAAYDLASLLQDSRLALPRPIIHRSRQLYDAAFPEETAITEQAYHVIGAQRNIKNLGIFARLNKRDHKPRYLAFIPALWKNLEENLKSPALKEVGKWMDEYLPAHRRHMVPPPYDKGNGHETSR